MIGMKTRLPKPDEWAKDVADNHTYRVSEHQYPLLGDGWAKHPRYPELQGLE